MTTSRLPGGNGRDPQAQPALVRPIRRPPSSAVGLLNVLLRYRYMVATMAVLLPVVVLAVVLTRPRTYTSTAEVVPQSPRLPTNLGGLAAQFGVSLPGAEASHSPAFYAELVRSRAILGAVADSSYEVDGVVGPLHRHVVESRRELPPAVLREEAMDWLDDELSSSASQRTGVVSLSLRAESPVLASQVLQRMLAELEQYNVGTRRSQARAEREFTEERLRMARNELRMWEERLTSFETANRQQQVPHVRAERERLTREVGFREQVVSSLVQAYEQARIDEVRDTPVFTVVDPPHQPARPDRRGLAAKLLAALIAGLALGVGLAFARNVLGGRGAAVADDEIAEFAALRRELADDVRHPVRGLRRALGRGAPAVPA
jgi:uncharacterized protein involved in exopolysaccharide biosynthesis